MSAFLYNTFQYCYANILKDYMKDFLSSDNTSLQRRHIFDELNRRRTVYFGTECIGDLFSNHIIKTPSGKYPIVLLGIGPFPNDWQHILNKQHIDKKIFWLESPSFEKQMPKEWYSSIPKHWEKLSIPEVLELIPSEIQIYRYIPAYRLFSKFWGPIIGKLQQKSIGNPIDFSSSQHIYIASTTEHLLTKELLTACKQLGFIPIQHSPHKSLLEYGVLFKEKCPLLFLSINLQGLDNEGYIFHLLKTLQIPVAIWFVDNPWHILSNLRLPWWKEAHLFITDKSFIPSLRQHGAQNIYYLPLAAWKHASFSNKTVVSPVLHSLVFIGSSAFPNKKKFFSGLKLPVQLLHKAYKYLDNDNIPHVHWWKEQLTIKNCWPDMIIRLAGLGAEYCSLLRKQLWLNMANHEGLTIFGDNEWKQYITNCTDIREPIDYYATVPTIYNNATYTLNISSLLLPEGLSQRHFDVWAVDGFLITDKTPGLSLFPKELTEPISIHSHKNLYTCINNIEKDPPLRTHLIAAWKKHIMSFHLYELRIQTILSLLHII